MKKVVYLAVLILSLGLISSKIEAQGFFIPQNEMQPRYEKLPPIRIPQRGLPSAVRSNGGSAATQTNQQPQVIKVQQRKISHYIAVDGRYIPVFADEEPQSVQEAVKDSQTAEEATDNKVKNIVESNPDITDKPAEATAPLKEEQPDIKQAVAEVKNNAAVAEVKNNATVAEVKKPIAASEVKKEISVSQEEPETVVKKADMPSLPQTEEVNSALPDYRNSYTKYVSDLQIFHQTGLFPENEALSQALSKMNSEKEIVLYKN